MTEGGSTDALVRARLGKGTSKSSSSMTALADISPKASSIAPLEEWSAGDADSENLFLFDGSSATDEQCVEHFMTLSSWYPGHETLRTETDITNLLASLVATGKDAKSLTSFDDMGSLIAQVKEEVDASIGPRDRSTLKELWSLAKRYEQDLLRQDSNDFDQEIDDDDDSARQTPKRKKRKAPSRSRSRGRDIKSLTKALRKSRKNSSSDSESSDVRTCVPSLLRKASISLLQPEQFANAKTLKKLVRTLKEKRVSSETYDVFYPQYVGEGQPSDVKKTLVKNREKAASQSALTLFEDVTCFWVSHTLGGEVSCEAILAHMLILFKLVHKHSSVFACRYARLFLAKVQDKCRYSDSFKLSEALASLDSVLYTQLCDELKSGKSTGRNSEDSAKGKGKGKKGKGKRGIRPLSTPLAPPPPQANPLARTKKKVCFFHNPQKGGVCRFGSACSDEHLNTNDPALAKRFADALKASGKKVW